jgi:arylsulfatase A-like enzyme
MRRALGWREPKRVNPVSTLRASERVVSLLRRARRGDAYLIHMMLPHFPYALDSECRLRPDPTEWLDRAAPAAARRANAADARRLRYSRYLEQLSCAHKVLARMFDALVEAGVYDESVVLVHGDHGSRITATPPEPPFADAMAPRDYVDAFATLFAAKLPGVAGGVDRRVLALEDLTAAVTRDGRLPADGASEAPFVWVDVGNTRFDQRPLPPFAHGRVGAEIERLAAATAAR